MQVREFPSLEAARAAKGPDEVVVALRGPGVPDRFGVLPAAVEVEAGDEVRSQPIGEFLQGWWGTVAREARRERAEAAG